MTSNAQSHLPLSGQAATFLSTEHWGLLGTRSMIWNEAFSRVSTFLNALSASVVALALVADATGFGKSFRVFALVLMPMISFLGVTTYFRLTQINAEDVFLLIGMNRLRHAYIEQAPELERYFTTGWHDDASGVTRSFLLDQPRALGPKRQFIITTPTVVATLDAAIVAAGAALLANHLGAGSGLVIAASIGTFGVAWVSLLSVQFRQLTMFRRYQAELVRFPSPSKDERSPM